MLAALVCASTGALAPWGVAHPPARGRAASPKMESEADLTNLATKLNPAIGYWCALALLH